MLPSAAAAAAKAAEDRAAIQRYLAEHRVTELLYQVLESICVEKPANPHQYIVDYLSKNHAGLVTVAASDAAVEGRESGEAVDRPVCASVDASAATTPFFARRFFLPEALGATVAASSASSSTIAASASAAAFVSAPVDPSVEAWW